MNGQLLYLFTTRDILKEKGSDILQRVEPSDPADWGGTVIKLYFHYCNTELLKKVKNILVLFTSVHDTLKTWLGDGMISAVYHTPVTSIHTNHLHFAIKKICLKSAEKYRVTICLLGKYYRISSLTMYK